MDGKRSMKLVEAKYANPRTMTRVGILNFDDRHKDEYFDARNVAMKFRMTGPLDHGDFNAEIIEVKDIYGGEVWLANDIGIKRGTEAFYQIDKHGWMLSGWRMGPGQHSPWALEKHRLNEAQYEPRNKNREQSYVFEMTEVFFNDKDVQYALSMLGQTEANWTKGLGTQSNTRVGYIDAFTTPANAEKVHKILQQIFFLKADQEVDYPLRAYSGYQSYD